MGLKLNKLTALMVAKLHEPGLYGDGGGLWLQITEGGSKSWIFRYTRGGKTHDMGMGPVHTVGLAEARQKALEARKLLLEGKDPLGEKRAAVAANRALVAGAVTFRECAERYIAAHADTWKHAAHRRQWPNSLAAYVYPVFGDASVSAIDVGMVLKAIESLWAKKPETASRVRARIEAILDWARVRGYREGENAARWRGHLDKLLPRRSRVKAIAHHPALPYVQIGAFIAELRQYEGVAAKALEFTILTACRTGETSGAMWAEFDLKAGVWTIPGNRMKAGREHRIPLCQRALAILESLPREGDYVFVGSKLGRPLSGMVMLLQLQRMQRADLTVHGFRSTFRDWAAERTNYPNHVVEQALAHAIGDKTEAAYRRGDLFEKRRRLAEDWASFCGKPEATGDNVMSIRRTAVDA